MKTVKFSLFNITVLMLAVSLSIPSFASDKVKLTFALEPVKEAFVFFAGTLFGRSYNFLAIFLGFLDFLPIFLFQQKENFKYI